MKHSVGLNSLRILASSSAIGLIALGTFAAAPARADGIPVTFAQYFQNNGAEEEWTITTSGNTTTITATGSVLFLFSGVLGLPFTGPEDATFTFSATSSEEGNCGVICGNGGSYTQPGYVGTFSFIDDQMDPGANLLSGTFAVTDAPEATGAQFSSSVGSSGGSFNASSTADNLSQLVLTSAFIEFTGQTQENSSWSLSSLSPDFTVGTVSGNQAHPGPSFAASGSGSFSSNPGPATAPEPATFVLVRTALLVIGVLRPEEDLSSRSD